MSERGKHGCEKAFRGRAPKLVLFLIAVTTACVLASCGSSGAKSASDASSVSESSAGTLSATEDIVDDSKTESGANGSDDNSTVGSFDAAADGLERYVTPENIAANSMTNFYLSKNGVLYCLGADNYTSEVESHASTSESLYEVLNAYYEGDPGGEPFNANLIIVSTDSSSSSVPTYSSGDSVRYYSSSDARDLKLVKITPNNYATPLFLDYAGSGVSYLHYNAFGDAIQKMDFISDMNLTDQHGNEYEGLGKQQRDDIQKLFSGYEKGEQITLSWYEGTKYNEIKVTADYPCYVIDSSLATEPYEEEEDVEIVSESSIITIEGEPTKDGYFEYDLSAVSPGLYFTNKGGILEIA